MNPTLYAALLLFTTFIALAISIECYVFRSLVNAKKLFFLMLSISGWAFFQFLNLVVPSIAMKEVIHYCLFIAIILTPLNFFNFVYSYVAIPDKGGFHELLQILFVVPVINLLMLLTNSMHQLFFTNFRLREIGPYKQLFSDFGVFFWVHTAFSYLVILLSIALLTYEYISNRLYFKKQILLLIAGSISPIIFNLIFLLDIDASLYDLTPVSLLLSGVLFGYAINKFQIFKTSPISRKLTLHSIQDGVLILDDDSMIVEYNTALETHFGIEKDLRYSRADLLPLTLRRILSLTANEQNYNQQVRVADENSMIHYFKVKKISVHMKNAQFYIYLLTDNNATSKLLKEIEEKQSTLMTIKENKLRFLSSISHELRAPLNTIKSVSELLSERTPLTSKDQQLLFSLADTLRHKSNLILDYAKIEAGEMKAIPVDISLDTLISLIQPHVLTYESLSKKPKAVNAYTVLLPLLEHINFGFKLLKRVILKPLEYRLSTHELCIIVLLEKEYGLIIHRYLTQPEALDSVNLSTEERLHLGVVSALFKSIGGNCTLHPISETDSSLSLSIPLSLTFDSGSDLVSLEPPRLLLIDDSIITFFVCQKICQNKGLDLDYAENLENALTLLKGGSTYNWILIDLHLENASGYDVVQQLRQWNTANTLFIAISSEQINLDATHLTAHGFDSFLLKPLRKADIESLLHMKKNS